MTPPESITPQNTTHDEIGLAYGHVAGHTLRSAYQPIYSLHGDHLAIVAARALVRPSRAGRPANPARFLARLTAADRRTIDGLGRSLQIANLPFLDFETRTLALRIDPMAPDALETLLGCLRGALDALEQDGFDRPRLVCELTPAKNLDSAISAALVRASGFRVALCDVGPDAADIARIVATRPDYVRFHGAWFRATAAQPDAVDLLTTLVTRLHAQKIEILADGIETTAQFQVARTIGADMLQGFLFSPPILAGTAFRQRPLRLPEILRPRAKIIALRRPA